MLAGAPLHFQVDDILREVENDFGGVVKRITGEGFIHEETQAKKVLSNHWEARYSGAVPEGTYLDKVKTLDLVIEAQRLRKRISTEVEVPLGPMGRVLRKKPTRKVTTESVWSDDFAGVHVMLSSQFSLEKFGKSDVGIDFKTGGTMDYKATVLKSQQSKDTHVIIDKTMGPGNLDTLDATLRSAVLALQAQTNFTFGVS